MVTTWSTAGVDEHEQFDYWREVVCSAFVHLSPERSDRGSFHGSIESVPLRTSSLSRIAADPQTVHRRTVDIARTPAPITYLNVQMAGTSTVTQHGRTAALVAGQAVLVDASAPFSMTFGERFQQWSVHLDADALVRRTGPLDALCARPLDASPALGALLIDVVSATWRIGNGCDDGDAARLDDQLSALVAALVMANTPARSAHTDLYERAVRCIEHLFRDPALTVPVLANELSVSVRLLHQVFAEHHQTVGGFLAETRLRAAEAMLRQRHETIAVVASTCGFGDLSHFSRQFRERFGVTPGSMRTRRL
jgi:AraC family transcriptional regulator, positive regulator of tynA and feaB